MLRGDQAREQHDAALANHEVVVAAAEFAPAHLVNAQSPPLGAELRGDLFQPDHPMGDTVQREVVLVLGEIIEQ